MIHYKIQRFNEQYICIDVFDLSVQTFRVFFLFHQEIENTDTKEKMLELLRREYPTTTGSFKGDSLERYAECFLIARDELIDQGVIKE